MSKLSADCCDCFAGLAEKNRLEIVNLLLKKKKMSVTEIARHFKLTQPTVSHHLGYLKKAGVLSSQKKGRRVYYFLSSKCREGRCGLFAR